MIGPLSTICVAGAQIGNVNAHYYTSTRESLFNLAGVWQKKILQRQIVFRESAYLIDIFVIHAYTIRLTRNLGNYKFAFIRRGSDIFTVFTQRDENGKSDSRSRLNLEGDQPLGKISIISTISASFGFFTGCVCYTQRRLYR